MWLKDKAFLIFILLWIAVLASALGVVYAKHESRHLFIEQEALRSNRDTLHSEWTQLILEQSTWAAHGRVDSIAAHELKMLLPPSDAIRVLTP